MCDGCSNNGTNMASAMVARSDADVPGMDLVRTTMARADDEAFKLRDLVRAAHDLLGPAVSAPFEEAEQAYSTEVFRLGEQATSVLWSNHEAHLRTVAQLVQHQVLIAELVQALEVAADEFKARRVRSGGKSSSPSPMELFLAHRWNRADRLSRGHGSDNPPRQLADFK